MTTVLISLRQTSQYLIHEQGPLRLRAASVSRHSTLLRSALNCPLVSPSCTSKFPGVREKSGDDICSDFTSVARHFSPMVEGCPREQFLRVENQPQSLAHRMDTGYQLVQVPQMNIPKMILHVRNAFKGTSPLVVCIPLVPVGEYALGLAQNKGKLV